MPEATIKRTDNVSPTSGHAVIGPDEMQKFAETLDAFEQYCSKADAERTKFGETLGETAARLAEISEHLQKREDEFNKRFDELEARLNRKSTMSAVEQRSDGSKRIVTPSAKAYFGLLRATSQAKAVEFYNQYKEELGADMVKALQLGDDPLGGYVAAPPEFVEEMIVDAQEMNPVRGIMRVRQTQRTSVKLPKQTGFLSAQWVSELATRGETAGTTFGQVEVPAHELHALVVISREELEDAFFDMESFLRQQFSMQFGLAEGVAFVTGTGNGMPEGFLTTSTVTGITSGTSGVLDADDLIALYYEPLEVYLPNSSWVAKRSTIKAIRQLKDMQGQYLWATSLASDARPGTILDRPYTMADAMPIISAGNKAVAFGDFRQAYTIVDRIVMEVITDIFSSKSVGAVEYSARRRVGGKVVQPQAIKTLTIKA